MSDPFTKFFEMIISVFKLIGVLFEMVINIQETLECPTRIWTHIGTCLFYWGVDTVMIILYNIFYWIVYIFIYLPTWCGYKAICFCTNKRFLSCGEFSPDDIIPSLSSFKWPFEFIYRQSGGDRFLYRDGGDLKNCYCIPPLKLAFRPLTHYSDIFGDDKSSKNSTYMLIAIFILLGVAVTKMGEKGSPTPVE